MASQLNIKSEEARLLAQELAKLTTTSVTQAVIDALRHRLAIIRYARTTKEERERELEDGFFNLIVGSRDHWKGFALSVDHGDLLYDEYGLPR